MRRRAPPPARLGDRQHPRRAVAWTPTPSSNGERDTLRMRSSARRSSSSSAQRRGQVLPERQASELAAVRKDAEERMTKAAAKAAADPRRALADEDEHGRPGLREGPAKYSDDPGSSRPDRPWTTPTASSWSGAPGHGGGRSARGSWLEPARQAETFPSDRLGPQTPRAGVRPSTGSTGNGQVNFPARRAVEPARWSSTELLANADQLLRRPATPVEINIAGRAHGRPHLIVDDAD
ncbi:histidine kinase OS=Streptomyces microflavus OX=1919 GN=G3I39_30805 PE=4 SV=1 [Streptomyces microflavus]